MVSQPNSNELYNLRWNSYFSNLINVFTDHQTQETLVDVTIGCEGQFIKAHRLVLSACSIYFQKIFQTHTTPQLLILLNDVKFENLRLVIQFMYKGEVKVADADMQQFLQLGKMLQVKGLCSVELHEKQRQVNIDANKEIAVPPEKSTNDKIRLPDNKTNVPIKVVDHEHIDPMEPPLVKKRKLPSPAPPDLKKKVIIPSTIEKNDIKKSEKRLPASYDDKDVKNDKNMSSSSPSDSKDVPRIPRPPNAFMIFANQWRKKLAVEYPNDSNKDISVRLGNMWKSLSPETKDAFYDDARKAEEEHKEKYPGYYYSPKEARHRKAIANITRAVHKLDQLSRDNINDITEPEFIEIKCEEYLDGGCSTPKRHNSH